jgi:hypothetical protein
MDKIDLPWLRAARALGRLSCERWQATPLAIAWL